jgi:uncharacterized protein with PIN domain
MIIAKCPKCNRHITEMKAQPMPAKDGNKTFAGAVYTCPFCSAILGAGPDPYELANEIAKRIKR